MDAADQQALTGAVIKVHELDLAQLWLDYVALGGDASEQDIRDYASATLVLPEKDRDALSLAVNEQCAAAQVLARAPFSDSPLSQAHKDSQGPCSST